MKQEYLNIIQEYTKDYPDVLIDEEWRDLKIEGLKRHIKISNYGRMAMYKVYYKRWWLMRGVISDGYKQVGISGKTKKVHRLVGQTFIPNPENKYAINHKNAKRSDNRVDNLEWVTIQENDKHALDNSLYLKGEEMPNSKITEETARIIKKELANRTLSFTELAKKLGVTRNTLTYIHYDNGWKHVS